jgi:hypothetical protein
MTGTTLRELQRVPTSGARAVEGFTVDGRDMLAVAQLAKDSPGAPAGMNGGDSNTDVLLLQRRDGKYRPYATLAAPGGEDVEFFTIGSRSFLAVASIRSGSGPYDYTTTSRIHEWDGSRFVELQAITTFAAKQWKHWRIGERHFLGLAQGLDLPHIEGPNRNSMIYEFDGEAFVEFQVIPSTWAYNWHAFDIEGEHFLAHADHTGPSVLYRWTGARYVPHQVLRARAGRAFADFTRDGRRHLLVAGLEEPPALLGWTGREFVPVQELEGLGAREITTVEHLGRLFLIRVNFILGTPADPRPSLESQVYEWVDGRFETVHTFATSGGTDVEVVSNDDRIEFVVSNSLSADLRFATDTVVYALEVDPAEHLPESPGPLPARDV